MPDLSILAACPLLAGLDAAAVQAVAERGQERRFDPGDHLCRAGEPRFTTSTWGTPRWSA